MSFNWWVNELWNIHMMKYYSAIKKEQITDTCNNIDESQMHFA